MHINAYSKVMHTISGSIEITAWQIDSNSQPRTFDGTKWKEEDSQQKRTASESQRNAWFHPGRHVIHRLLEVHLLQNLSTGTFKEAIRAWTELQELPLKDVFCRMSSLPSVAMFCRHCKRNQRRYVPQAYIYSTDPTPAEICRFECVCKNTKLTLF